MSSVDYSNSSKMESSITKIDHLVGDRIEVIAYGISYLGTLTSIDYEKGVLILSDAEDSVTLDLERIECFSQYGN